jgi:hypothetical protein
MPHLAAAAINAWLTGQEAIPVTQPVLDSTHRAIISPALNADARGIYYSAVLTVADAINGISAGYFSWGTIKLYYAAFYAARVILAANDVALFYPANGKPHSLVLLPGQCAKKEKGVTHKVVWEVLARELSTSTLLGSIGSQSASQWLMSLREEANYKTPRFPDPMVPQHFAALDSAGIENAFVAYVTDTSFLYSFDPDHAALAFPLECLRGAGVALRRRSLGLDTTDIGHIEVCLNAAGINPSAFLAIL